MPFTIRCLAVDDEEYAATLLAEYIHKVPFLTLVGTSTNPLEALTWVQQGQVDLVFLDIQMPELTGLQFLRLCSRRCQVVLTTAYPEYALDGYENDVVDYLLKPVSFERFVKAAQKALTLAQTWPPPASPVPVPQGSRSFLFVKGERKNHYRRVDHADINYVEGWSNYVKLHLSSGERLVTYHSLRELEQELPHPAFVRVHRSYLVALAKISLIDGNVLYVQDTAIPLGETYREQFFRLVRDAQ